MEKLKYTLLIWNKLSTHVRVRDRSIKILQYGCQMLIGFYGTQLTKEMSHGLRLTKSMASTSRKAFWLLKSVNHVQALIHMIENYEHTTDECYVDLVDILEQVFLILYYFYENLVFMARTKLVSFTEDTLDGWGNISWFMEDLAGFVAAFLRTYISRRKLRIKETAFLLADKSVQQIGHQNTATSSQAVCSGYDLTKEINELKTRYSDALLALAIALFELGASMEAVDLFKSVFGVAIGDTGMGLCGVTSSVLILYEATINAMRAEAARL